MRHVVMFYFASLLAMASPVVMSAEGPEQAAESAALSWLALVDAGNYAQSWIAASTLFRQKVPQSQWQAAAAASARGPLGALKSRQLLSATLAHTLPGAPDGVYVVVQFTTSFEHKTTAVETITPMKDQDGAWRVSGYFIN
jgi:hypothetical protein